MRDDRRSLRGPRALRTFACAHINEPVQQIRTSNSENTACSTITRKAPRPWQASTEAKGKPKLFGKKHPKAKSKSKQNNHQTSSHWIQESLCPSIHPPTHPSFICPFHTVSLLYIHSIRNKPSINSQRTSTTEQNSKQQTATNKQKHKQTI